MAGVRISSAGRPNRSTSWAAPPSTLTKAIPPFLPRMLSHLTEVPVNVNEAVAPGSLDSLAAPPVQPTPESKVDPLRPAWGSLPFQSPLKVPNCVFDSSIRAPAPFAGGGLTAGDGLAAGGVLAPGPPPPPPQETSMAAANQAPAYLMQRFMDHFPCEIAQCDGPKRTGRMRKVRDRAMSREARTTRPHAVRMGRAPSAELP